MFREARLSPPEKAVLATATYYVACAYRGSARYDRLKASSFEEVLSLAPKLYEGDRGIMIYAVNATGSQAMIGSWEP